MPRFKRPNGYNNDEDPLTVAMAPPPDETPKEREIRLAEEATAQRRSDAIDEELNRQKMLDKKAPKCIRILLLGACPASSGHVTLLISAQVKANLVWAFFHSFTPNT